MDDQQVIAAIERLNLDFLTHGKFEQFALGMDVWHAKNHSRFSGIEKLLDGLPFRKSKPQMRPHAGEFNWDLMNWKKRLIPGPADKKIVVYTCITGEYEDPLPPLFFAPRIEYKLFTDNETFFARGNKLDGWNPMAIPDVAQTYSKSLMNRYVKMHSFELFAGKFDYAIYVDGCVQPVSDLSQYVYDIDQNTGMAFHEHSDRDCIYEEAKACHHWKKGNLGNIDRQIERYKSEGFPKHYGMLECPVIVTDLHNIKAKELLQRWWVEFLKSASGRDQLALPYVLWKAHILSRQVATLGHNIWLDAKIRRYHHGKRS